MARGLVAMRLTDDEWNSIKYILRLYKWGVSCPLDFTGSLEGDKTVRAFRVLPIEKVMIKSIVKAWRAGLNDVQIREILANEGVPMPEE